MNPLRLSRAPRRAARLVPALLGLLLPVLPAAAQKPSTLTGAGAYGDWRADAPGVRRRLTSKDLPAPFSTKSATSFSSLIPRPANAWPKAPEGFVVEEYASGFREPRILRVAPNGDLFVADSSANVVRVLRPAADGGPKPEVNEVFLSGLKQPFGIAFYPPGDDPKWVYIANTNGVVRVPYRNGMTRAEAKPQELASVSAGGKLPGGGHWTRDIVFSPDGKRMFVSIGSRSNVTDDEEENRRARIIEFDPEGGNEKPYATGLRNPVGLAIDPATGAIWTTVNERDGLGDDLPPDYVTRVKEGGFYGWPWYYIGGIQEPRLPDAHPDLRARTVTPDVLFQPHSAALGLAFCTPKEWPAEYRGNVFVAFHGSWNRAKRTGYKIVYVPVKDGRATGEYVDFLTGFVTPDGGVWGRPVGVAFGKDGSLYVSDDGSNRIWRVRMKR